MASSYSVKSVERCHTQIATKMRLLMSCHKPKGTTFDKCIVYWTSLQILEAFWAPLDPFAWSSSQYSSTMDLTSLSWLICSSVGRIKLVETRLEESLRTINREVQVQKYLRWEMMFNGTHAKLFYSTCKLSCRNLWSRVAVAAANLAKSSDEFPNPTKDC